MTIFCLATELSTILWWREERAWLKTCKNLKTEEGVRLGHIFIKRIEFIKPMKEGETGWGLMKRGRNEGWEGGVTFFQKKFFFVFHWWLCVPAWPSSCSHETGPPGAWARIRRQKFDREIENKRQNDKKMQQIHESIRWNKKQERHIVERGRRERQAGNSGTMVADTK